MSGGIRSACLSGLPGYDESSVSESGGFVRGPDKCPKCHSDDQCRPCPIGGPWARLISPCGRRNCHVNFVGKMTRGRAFDVGCGRGTGREHFAVDAASPRTRECYCESAVFPNTPRAIHCISWPCCRWQRSGAGRLLSAHVDRLGAVLPLVHGESSAMNEAFV
jgi:hypothetical protein